MVYGEIIGGVYEVIDGGEPSIDCIPLSGVDDAINCCCCVSNEC